MSQAFEVITAVALTAGVIWGLEKLKPWLTGLLL